MSDDPVAMKWPPEKHQGDLLLFRFGLPLVIGILLGTDQAGIGHSLPWGLSILFWVTTTLASWLIFDVFTLLVSRLLAPWSPPLIVTLVVGIVVASLPARWAINRYLVLYEPYFKNGRRLQPLPDLSFSLESFLTYLQLWGGILLLWIAANIFFDQVVGLPRYRVAGHGPTAPTIPLDPLPSPVARSLLFKRLPRGFGDRIVALQSEDHYLRVHSDQGDALILYRLADAIAELEASGFKGLRVHRSYWVNLEHATGLRRDGRTLVVVTDTGLTAPVSQSYREVARMAGLDIGGKSPT